MKTISILTVALLLLSFTSIETKKRYYSNGKQKDQVEINNGMFNGKYMSWYYNGKLKAEGTFKNNQRIGKWIVYDSLGKLRMVREYENNFTFKTLVAIDAKGENITLPEKVDYELKRNKDGFFEYPSLNEKDILFSQENFRIIDNNAINNLLFEKNNLYNTLLKNVLKTKKLTAYTENDFVKKYNIESLKSKMGKEELDVVGYKVKEISFFNSGWQLMETRIIGFSPLIKNKKDSVVSELFWIYYPESRGILASESVEIKDEPLITNLENLLYFRYFGSLFINEAPKDNAMPENISDHVSDKPIEKTEMDLLDTEHNLWLSLTGKE